eukprot:5537249-Pyramimonas_sp.AAC.1
MSCSGARALTRHASGQVGSTTCSALAVEKRVSNLPRRSWIWLNSMSMRTMGACSSQLNAPGP